MDKSKMMVLVALAALVFGMGLVSKAGDAFAAFRDGQTAEWQELHGGK